MESMVVGPHQRRSFLTHTLPLLHSSPKVGTTSVFFLLPQVHRLPAGLRVWVFQFLAEPVHLALLTHKSPWLGGTGWWFWCLKLPSAAQLLSLNTEDSIRDLTSRSRLSLGMDNIARLGGGWNLVCLGRRRLFSAANLVFFPHYPYSKESSSMSNFNYPSRFHYRRFTINRN